MTKPHEPSLTTGGEISDETIYKLLVLLKRVPEGPYYYGPDDAEDCPPHAGSGLSMVDSGRTSEWPAARLCEAPMAKLIAEALTALPSILAELQSRRSLLREEVGEGSLAMTPASSLSSGGRPPVAKTTA